MPEKRVRWGLLSTARINERLIPAMRETERAELVGVASRSQAKADEYAKERGIPRTYGSYEAMLADPDIDAVYISLPNGYHEEWVVKSADAGKHVLCEKPLALTVEEVNSMAAAAKRNNVIVQEAAMYRFDPQTAKVQALIDSGAIGEIRTIQSFFGFTLKNDSDIRLDPAIGGGSLWDLGSYQVSFSRLALKANPVEVSAWQTATDQGVDLTFSGQMRFAGGAVSQFVCSFDSVPHWMMDFMGTNGRINLDIPWKQREEPSNVRLYQEGTSGNSAFGDNATGLVDTFTFEGGKAYHHQVDAMAASILDGAPPVLSLDESSGNVATMVALYTSARENRVVRVESS